MIPHTVHRCWLAGPEPEWTRPFRDTWDRPGWKVIDWDDARVGQLRLVNQDVFDRAEEIAPFHFGQLKADVLRYEILHRYGGVWVDADFECLKPIDPLIEDAECFAAWVDDKWINNALMGAVQGHPFIGRLIDTLPANVARFAKSRPAKMTGPQFLTSTWRRHPEGVTLIDREHVYPFTWTELDYSRADIPAEAYAVHHWLNQRREKGLPCPA